MNEWQWYFLMQHYGVPTRLLDWTDGALIGLYFALRDNGGCHDAAVWVLDPLWLNRKAIRKNAVLSPDAFGVSPEDTKKVGGWLPTRFKKRARLPRRPVAIYPSHIVGRIRAQRSCFTIHGSDADGLEKLAQQRGARLVKIIVPGFEVKKIKRDLETCGIDDATVFPDLGGVARVLTTTWQAEECIPPQRGVCTRICPSAAHGVGVFAIRAIRKGTRLFDYDLDEIVWVNEKDVPKRPAAIRKLYEEFGVFKEGRFGVPSHFNRLTMSWYLKKSKNPNVSCDENYKFRAARAIRVGQELTVSLDMRRTGKPRDLHAQR